MAPVRSGGDGGGYSDAVRELVQKVSIARVRPQRHTSG